MKGLRLVLIAVVTFAIAEAFTIATLADTRPEMSVARTLVAAAVGVVGAVVLVWPWLAE